MYLEHTSLLNFVITLFLYDHVFKQRSCSVINYIGININAISLLCFKLTIGLISRQKVNIKQGFQFHSFFDRSFLLVKLKEFLHSFGQTWSSIMSKSVSESFRGINSPDRPLIRGSYDSFHSSTRKGDLSLDIVLLLCEANSGSRTFTTGAYLFSWQLSRNKKCIEGSS